MKPNSPAPHGSRVLLAVDWLDSVPDEAEHATARLWDAGFVPVVYPTAGRTLGEKEMMALLPGVAGVIAGPHVFSRAVLDQAESLRVISRHGAGFETIDLDACTEHGVVVTNAGGGANSTAVAEFTLSLILSLSRRINYAEKRLRDGDWTFRSLLSSSSVFGKTLGLVGLGHIGREVARMAHDLGMTVIYYDLKRDLDIEQPGYLEFVEYHGLIPRSDYVSIHVALNRQTYHMFGVREMHLMKRSAYLVNTARGGIVDEQALCAALEQGALAGAALDTFESEPLPSDHPLLQAKANVILTPHVAGITDDAKAAMLAAATTNLLDVLAGRRPGTVTNPTVYGR